MRGFDEQAAATKLSNFFTLSTQNPGIQPLILCVPEPIKL